MKNKIYESVKQLLTKQERSDDSVHGTETSQIFISELTMLHMF